MTSLVTPIPQRMGHPSRNDFTRPSTSRTLLNLDCSADLASYVRSLGPGVQTRSHTLSSEALRAQFEEHRDYIIRHLQETAKPTPIPTLTPAEIPLPYQHARPITCPSTTVPPPPVSAPPSRPPTAPIVAPPPQFAPRSRTPTPTPGDLDTYPTALLAALEQCDQIPEDDDDDTIYHVIEDVNSNYMDDTSDIIGTYRSRQAANLKVAEHFFYNGIWSSGVGAGEEPEIEVSKDGGLRMATMTDGSLGGYTSVYMRRGKLESETVGW